jgi:hypothetical protein
LWAQLNLRQTYFDAERPRTDPIVCLNVLTLFYSMGRGHELANTLEWVLGVLEHRAYLDGTRYYETAECFLFFSMRLLRQMRSHHPRLHARLASLLRERVLERSGCAGDALALAMRVLVGAAVGLRMERDLAALLPLQCEDGGWGPSWIYKYGSSGIKIGNRGLSTALALNAIAALQSPPQELEKEKVRMQKQEKERRCAVEITSAPLPYAPVPSGLHGSATTKLPSLQVRRRRWKANLIVRAFAKGILAFVCPRNGSSLSRA